VPLIIKDKRHVVVGGGRIRVLLAQHVARDRQRLCVVLQRLCVPALNFPKTLAMLL